MLSPLPTAVGLGGLNGVLMAEGYAHFAHRWTRGGFERRMARPAGSHLSQKVEIERRLAALLAADAIGFSRLINADELGAMRLLAFRLAGLPE
jgi:hypothetical protein